MFSMFYQLGRFYVDSWGCYEVAFEEEVVGVCG